MTHTAQELINAGSIPRPDGGVCTCRHLFGEHTFEASFGSWHDGGLIHCQYYPDCLCTGTWNAKLAEVPAS
jgi:hypothetical protein